MTQLATLLARAQAVAAAVLPESITAEQVGSLMADIVRLMDSTDQAASQVNTFVARIEAIEQQVQAQQQSQDRFESYVEQQLSPLDDELRDIVSNIETLQTTATQDRNVHTQRTQALATRLATTEGHITSLATRLTTAERGLGNVGETTRAITRSDYLGQFETQTAATNNLTYDYITTKHYTTAHFEVRNPTMRQTATVRTHYYAFDNTGVARGLQEMNLGENIFTRTFDIDHNARTINYHPWRKVLLLSADTPLFVEATATGVNVGLNATNRLQDGHQGQGTSRRWVSLPIASSETAGIMLPLYVRKLHTADANATRALETLANHHTATTQALAQATEQARQKHEVAMQSIASLTSDLTLRINEASAQARADLEQAKQAWEQEKETTKFHLEMKIRDCELVTIANKNSLDRLASLIDNAASNAQSGLMSAVNAHQSIDVVKQQLESLTERIAALEARP